MTQHAILAARGTQQPMSRTPRNTQTLESVERERARNAEANNRVLAATPEGTPYEWELNGLTPDDLASTLRRISPRFERYTFAHEDWAGYLAAVLRSNAMHQAA